MRLVTRADDVQVVGDEQGFELHVDTDEGDRFVFRIHHLAEQFGKNVDETIGTWLREREDARATHVPNLTEDDLDGYDLGDPKRVEIQRAIDRGGR